MLAVSLSWAIVVELYPSSDRPYVDSTSNNSIFELILGHNGTERILGRDSSPSNIKKAPNENSKNIDDKENSSPMNKPDNKDSTHNSPNDDYIGNASPFRLWIKSIYGQISWLLIMDIASMIVCSKKIKIKTITMKEVTFIFWEIWFFTMFIFFSFAGFYHRYYLCMIAPSISILCGIGIPKMISSFKEKSSWKQFILPISFILTMILEINHILKYDEVPLVLEIIIFASTFICILFMLLYYLKKNKKHSLKVISITLFTAILISPFYWALTPVIYVPSLVKPSAGPDIGTNDSKDINSNMSGSSMVSNEDFALQQYLVTHYKKGSFLVVALRSNDVAKLIMSTGLPAYAYGGFLGNDNSLTLDKLKEYVAEGKITYFLISREGVESNSEITDYVKEHATLIDESEYHNKFTNNIDDKKNNKSLYCFENPLETS